VVAPVDFCEIFASTAGGESQLVGSRERVRAGSFLWKASAVSLALILALLAGLEIVLPGPFGMSGYVIYRAARTFARDLATPAPPSIAGFANAGPNVVVIVLDCYRYDYVENDSPHLRRFGEAGWRFDRYYSAASWTKPSTASLFTGLQVRRHFVLRGGGSQLPAEAVTLAELMRAQGFRTAGFVWNPHLTSKQAFDQGFDFYVDDARRGSKDLLRRFFAWVDRERPERFFAYIHFQGTHDPYYYDNDLTAILSAPGYPGDLDFSTVDYKFAVQNGRRLSPEEAAHLQHVAEGKARRVDRQAVGGFLDRFAASGLPENTMVVITSDHGDAFFEHSSVSHGDTVYNEEIHVPLMIHFPRRFSGERGFPSSGVASCPASTVDILPTVMDFVGAPAPPGIDGVSLVPSPAGEGPCRKAVISERTVPSGAVVGAALVSEDRKLLVDYVDGGRELKLFDLSADPGETRDLSAESARQASELDADLIQLLNDDGSSMAPWAEVSGEISPEHAKALRALGYVD
jgi:arylsulfatase A-like enzyme